MAESAVKLTANWLGNVLVEEGKYLWGAEDKVEELRNELLWMQRFLKKAESLENMDEVMDQWVLQIKEYVSEAGDIVDQFIIDVVSRRRRSGWARRLERWARIGEELWALHQVASSIDSLTLKVSKLTTKLKTYGVNPADGFRTYRTQEAASSEGKEGQRLSYAGLDGKKPVGLVEDTEKIVTALLDGSDQQRRVVAMYGMGGLGKTTLALEVYDHSRIKNHFVHRAWAYISKQFQIQNVLQTLLADLTSKSTDMYSRKKVDTLKKDFREVLRKSRCLVVLDDVWETKVWDDLKSMFPRDGGEAGSKVLFTTRKEDVAKHADPSALAKPDPLSEDDSWKLLKQSLGWVDDGESRGNKQHSSSFRRGPEMFGRDGPKVEELGKEMVKNCNGIPLALVVLGGILRKKESLQGWSLVSENISSYLRRGNDHGKSYMEVLALSYTDLPYHLKPCFLHLANFPEDYEIHAEKLYRMWAAEGLIAWPYDRVSNTETLEDIADEYLDLLAQAGMVQIVNKASNGRIKSVRIHDLMRDVCLQRAATENFFTTIDHRAYEPQCLSSSMNHARLLHMAIYLAEDVNNYLPDFLTLKAHKHLRSLLLFSGQEIRAVEQVPNWMKRICNDFPWLRVLDIEELCLKGRLRKDVKNMKHLRYLSLKGTEISDIPSSIGDLMFLQTLDLRVSFSGSPIKIPNTLWKLERLRHLFLPKKPYQIKKSKFLCLHTLTCLEVLKNLEVGMLKAEDLLKIRRLKKLSMKGFAEDVKSIRNIVNSPAAKAGHLRSCSLCVEGNVLDADPGMLSRFDCLHLLKVKDKFSCFKENVLPQSLAELHMESCQLEKDPMEILGSLNHLKHLSLGYNSFVGKEMACQVNSFPQLLKLNLQGLTNLEKWTVDENSMIKLNELIIVDCLTLKQIPRKLPRSVQVTCFPFIPGIEEYDTCNYFGTTPIYDDQRVITGRQRDTREVEELLLDDGPNKVVLLGPAGVGKSTVADFVSRGPKIRERFNTITWIRLPHCLNIEDMMQPKCLLILAGSATPSSRDVDKILGARIPDGSKILLTINALSLNQISTKEHKNVHQKIISELDPLNCYGLLHGMIAYCHISYSLLPPGQTERVAMEFSRRCSGQPQSVILLGGALQTKKSLPEWENFCDKVIKVADDSLPEGLYALCYEDLSHCLQDCFVYLAMFPENSEISARKLQHMWVAAGFVGLTDDGKSRKKSKEGIGEVGKLLENKAASYLDKLVARRMAEVEKRSLDGSIATCRLHISLRSMCLQKAKEKGFMRAEVKSSNERGPTGRSDKRWLNLPRQCLCLGEQREEQLEEQREKQREDQLEEQKEEHVPTMSAPRLNEIEHLAVCVGQSAREILDDPASVSDKLRSLLFFPEARATVKRRFSWQIFKTICNRFTHLLVLDLEGMDRMTGALPEDVGNLRKLKYLSLRGTCVSGLPPTIQQLGHLLTLDLRVIPSLTIPCDSFRFPQLRHLYLPELFSVITSSKMQLSGSDHLEILANLRTDKVDLNCVSDLKSLRRVSVNHIHAKDELDDILKLRGTTIELIIKSEIFNSDILLSSFQNLSSMTIKGTITAPLSESMFPKRLKRLKLKHTKLADDPNPILRQLPELTHLIFDHDSFLGKRMVISSGFVQLFHLVLRLLDKLEELDMTEAVHLRHVRPRTIKCWRIKVKYPRADAGIDRQEPSLNADGNDAEESEIDSDEMTEEEETSEQMETDVETSKPIGDPNSESPSASYTIHAAEITEEEEAVEQMSSGMHTNRETYVGPSKLIGNGDFKSGDNVHATEITEEEGAIEDLLCTLLVHATEIAEEEGAIADTHVAEITEEEGENEQM